MTLIKIYMTHELDKLLNYPLPDGFHFKLYNSKDDIEKWADILTQTKEFSTKKTALSRFESEFTPYLSDVKERMLFIKTSDNEVVGTATAWYGMLNNKVIGRLHWVGIKPEFQSQKLGRPLVAEAMRILQVKHEKAYLTTQAHNLIAIYLYLTFGWTPLSDSKEQKEDWDTLSYIFNLNIND